MNNRLSTVDAALVVKWLPGVTADAAVVLFQRLAKAQMPATWAIAAARQAEHLRLWGGERAGMDAALLVESCPGDDDGANVSQLLGGRLANLRAQGAVRVDAVLASNAFAAGPWPRIWRGLGVHGVVTEAPTRGQAATRALPFGVWQFAPRIDVPSPRRWQHRLGLVRPPVIGRTCHGAEVATIDLGAAAAIGRTAWLDIERAIDQAIDASRRQEIAATTIGKLAARLAGVNASRPQRSILRAA